MDRKKPSGVAYKRMRMQKEEAATRNTPKLTSLFKPKEGSFISYYNRRFKWILELIRLFEFEGNTSEGATNEGISDENCEQSISTVNSIQLEESMEIEDSSSAIVASNVLGMESIQC